MLGLDRWVLRVAAYAGLMTDRYPPFRLDQGATDVAPEPRLFEAAAVAEPAVAEAAPTRKWTAGRIVAIIAGSILALISLGLLAGGVTGMVYDLTQRDSDGFLMSPSEQFDTASYALVSETLDIDSDVPQWVIDELIGTVRIKSESEQPVFIGIASESDAESYVGDVRRAVVTDIDDPDYSPRPGGPPSSPPTEQTFWVASTSGAGDQMLDWDVEDGDWVIVVMNPDGSAGVAADLRIGAEVDDLIWIAIGFVVAGLLMGAGAAALIYVGSRRPRSMPASRLVACALVAARNARMRAGGRSPTVRHHYRPSRRILASNCGRHTAVYLAARLLHLQSAARLARPSYPRTQWTSLLLAHRWTRERAAACGRPLRSPRSGGYLGCAPICLRRVSESK